MNANGRAVALDSARAAPVPTSGAMVRASASVEPQSMAELKDFAKMASDSRFFGVDSPQQALIIAMAGKDLGFSYTQALRAFHVIKGKPSLSADGMVAACLAHRDVCEYFRLVESTDTSVTWETKRVGGEPIRASYTMKDAERAGLVNDMYRKHPKRMLSARCKAYLARDVYPEILMGLYTPDEIDEMPAERRPFARTDTTLTPQPQATPVVDAEIVPASEDGLAAVDEILKFIADARSEDDLKLVSPRIRAMKDDARFSDAQRRKVGVCYRERKETVKQRAAPSVEPEPPIDDTPPEPGGEG
jgi:hypothetical protein